MNEDVKIYKCDNCGSVMQFDIKTQTLKCNSCGTEVEIINDRKVQEFDFSDILLQANTKWDNVKSITCKVCGAETIIEENATATICNFCGSSNILESKQASGIKPEAIIPFKVDKTIALDSINKWIKWRLLAPNSLRTLHQKDKFKGMYVPYWTYDANAYASYTAQGGQNYTTTVTRNGKTETVTKIRWHSVSGTINNFFDDVLVNASSGTNSNIISSIEPFNTSEQKPFSSSYIAGFLAEHYAVTPDIAYNTAKNKMHNELVSMASRQVLSSYDHVSSINLRETYEDVTCKHLLVPVWIAGYFYKSKYFNLIVNAQTAHVYGEYPKSAVKIALLVIFILIIISIIYYISSVQAEMKYSMIEYLNIYIVFAL